MKQRTAMERLSNEALAAWLNTKKRDEKSKSFPMLIVIMRFITVLCALLAVSNSIHQNGGEFRKKACF